MKINLSFETYVEIRQDAFNRGDSCAVFESQREEGSNIVMFLSERAVQSLYNKQGTIAASVNARKLKEEEGTEEEEEEEEEEFRLQISLEHNTYNAIITS